MVDEAQPAAEPDKAARGQHDVGMFGEQVIKIVLYAFEQAGNDVVIAGAVFAEIVDGFA